MSALSRQSHGHGRAVICAAAALGVACGPTSNDGDAAAIFEREVVPVLEEGCTASVCHGYTEEARLAGETLEVDAFAFDVDANGRIVDRAGAREVALREINTVESPDFSSILRKPLSETFGGLPHAGGANFPNPESPGYRALRRWIDAEARGGEDPSSEPLDEREAFFAERIQPMLVSRGCARATCHGPTSFVPFVIDPGVADLDGERRFDREMTDSNYRRVRRFLDLDGGPLQSRLVRKILPLDLGGITHRGGNTAFVRDADDPALEDLRTWIGLERDAWLTEEDPGAVAEPTGFVFVAGPLRAESRFDIAGWNPGTDIWLRSSLGPDGESENLTASLHDGDADVRDPTVSFDGRRIAFAMRESEEAGFDLWEMDLDTRQAVRLTHDSARLPSGGVSASVTPTYGSDGWLYFASNRHDVQAERLDANDVDLYRLRLSDRHTERLTFTPGPEIEPSWYRVGPFAGYIVFSYRRAIDARDETVGFSIEADVLTNHVFFGITPALEVLYQYREMPDGRSLVVAASPLTVWGGGVPAIVDRNLGPDLTSADDPNALSVAGYTPTFRPLVSDVVADGLSPGGLYRDPVALPDGTVLVSHATGPFDVTDPDAAPRFVIEHARVVESDGTCSDLECIPSLADVATWVDLPDASAWSPEPVFARPVRFEIEEVLDPSDPTIVVALDMTVNDGVMLHLPPTSRREFRDDVVALRLVEASPASPSDWFALDGSGVDPSFGPATTAGIGVHMPAQVLAEVPLSPDRSVYLTVPPNTPFRTQLLDADGMNVGVQHNRWIYVSPGEEFPIATVRGMYDQICAGCHGTRSGVPDDIARVPDSVTQATVTLARFEDQNPRRPREPEACGDATRRDVSFESAVQPILDERCASGTCHGGEDPAGGVDLSAMETEWFSVAYETLLAPGDRSGGGREFVDEANASARGSFLVELLTGRELDAPGSVGPHPGTDLTETELRALIRWIEVGAPYRLPVMR